VVSASRTLHRQTVDRRVVERAGERGRKVRLELLEQAAGVGHRHFFGDGDQNRDLLRGHLLDADAAGRQRLLRRLSDPVRDRNVHRDRHRGGGVDRERRPARQRHHRRLLDRLREDRSGDGPRQQCAVDIAELEGGRSHHEGLLSAAT
jgi:hypothetical protein